MTKSPDAPKESKMLGKVYGDRNHVAILAAELAKRAGYEVAIGTDPEEPDWPVLYIMLPTGQVSWHMKDKDLQGLTHRFPRRDIVWDGHTVRQKNKRIRQFISEKDPHQSLSRL